MINSLKIYSSIARGTRRKGKPRKGLKDIVKKLIRAGNVSDEAVIQ